MPELLRTLTDIYDTLYRVAMFLARLTRYLDRHDIFTQEETKNLYELLEKIPDGKEG